MNARKNWLMTSDNSIQQHTAKIMGESAAREGREQKHERTLQVCLLFQRVSPEGNLIEGNGALYGDFRSAPLYRPGKGVQFVFEGMYAREWGHWQQGVWMVTLEQGERADNMRMEEVWVHIAGAKEAFIREGELIRRILVEPATIEEAG